MKRVLVIALISLVAVAVAVPAPAAGPTVKSLARQIKALQKEVKTLKTQVTRARGGRCDLARLQRLRDGRHRGRAPGHVDVPRPEARDTGSAPRRPSTTTRPASRCGSRVRRHRCRRTRPCSTRCWRCSTRAARLRRGGARSSSSPSASVKKARANGECSVRSRTSAQSTCSRTARVISISGVEVELVLAQGEQLRDEHVARRRRRSP